MLTRKDFNGLILILLLAMNCILFVSPTFYKSISNILFIANFLLICGGLLINGKYIFNNKTNIIYLFCLLSFSAFSLIFTSGGMGSILNLFTSIGGVLLFSECSISKITYKLMMFLCCVLYVLLVILSFDAWKIYVSGIYEINPNSIGVALFVCYSAICLYFTNGSKMKNYLFFIAFSAITIYSIYLTNCRSALLGIVLFIISNFLPFVKNIVNKNKAKLFLIITIIGVLFPIIYVEMYKNNIDFTIPFIGKRIYTGREILWMNMLESMTETDFGIIMGVGSNNVTEMGIISNVHNWYLSILYSFGIFSFIVYYLIFINKIKKRSNSTFLLILLIIFLIGFVETAAMGSVCKTFIFVIFTIDTIKMNTIKEN